MYAEIHVPFTDFHHLLFLKTIKVSMFFYKLKKSICPPLEGREAEGDHSSAQNKSQLENQHRTILI
jgi:hypothetical protein